MKFYRTVISEQEWVLYHEQDVTIGQVKEIPLHPISETPFYYHREGGYEFWKKLMLSTGHNPDKIDTAVPQDWWNDWHKKYGSPPKACWTYEEMSIFGAPLFYGDVYAELEKLLKDSIKEYYEHTNSV